jgi:hypothetical protein
MRFLERSPVLDLWPVWFALLGLMTISSDQKKDFKTNILITNATTIRPLRG